MHFPQINRFECHSRCKSKRFSNETISNAAILQNHRWDRCANHGQRLNVIFLVYHSGRFVCCIFHNISNQIRKNVSDQFFDLSFNQQKVIKAFINDERYYRVWVNKKKFEWKKHNCVGVFGFYFDSVPAYVTICRKSPTKKKQRKEKREQQKKRWIFYALHLSLYY